jgi:hypothetical protein
VPPSSSTFLEPLDTARDPTLWPAVDSEHGAWISQAFPAPVGETYRTAEAGPASWAELALAAKATMAAAAKGAMTTLAIRI